MARVLLVVFLQLRKITTSINGLAPMKYLEATAHIQFVYLTMAGSVRLFGLNLF